MSPEIDLLNTYPVCGHEPLADSHHLVRPMQRGGYRRTAAETDAGPANPTRGPGPGRTETPDSPDSDAVATQR
jgi:hypothetical protein